MWQDGAGLQDSERRHLQVGAITAFATAPGQGYARYALSSEHGETLGRVGLETPELLRRGPELLLEYRVLHDAEFGLRGTVITEEGATS